MVNEYQIAVAKNLAEKQTLERLAEELEKTQIPEIEEAVEEVLMERLVCPNCDNDLFLNEKDDIAYCPVDNYQVQL